MDTRFLKEISEAYVIDSDLDLKHVDNIYSELYNLVKYVRIVDPPLYEELYNLDRIRQQQILSKYLDFTFKSDDLGDKDAEEVFVELDASTAATTTMITTGLVLIPVTVLVLIFIVALVRRQISKAIFHVLFRIGQLFHFIGKWITKQSQYLKLRYAIVQQNFEKCYKRCGITDMRQISSLAYVSVRKDSFFATSRSAEQGSCLRICYLEQLIETIALYFEVYFACLKRTGSFEAIKPQSSEQMLKIIHSTSISFACQDYYKKGKDALDNFHTVLDFVYNPAHEDLKIQWVERLYQRLELARDQIVKADSETLERYFSEDERMRSRPQQMSQRKPQQNQPQQMSQHKPQQNQPQQMSQHKPQQNQPQQRSGNR